MKEGGRTGEGRDSGGEGKWSKERVSALSLQRAAEIHKHFPTEVTDMGRMKVLTYGASPLAVNAEFEEFVAQSPREGSQAIASIERTKLIGGMRIPQDRVFLYDGSIRRDTVTAQMEDVRSDIFPSPRSIEDRLGDVRESYAASVDMGFDLMRDEEVRAYLKEVQSTLQKDRRWPKEIVLPLEPGDKGMPTPRTVNLFQRAVCALSRSTGQAYLTTEWDDANEHVILRSLANLDKDGEVQEVVNTALVESHDDIRQRGKRQTQYWKYYKVGEPLYTQEMNEGTKTLFSAEHPDASAMLPDTRFDFDLYAAKEPVAPPLSARSGWNKLEAKRRTIESEEKLQDPLKNKFEK